MAGGSSVWCPVAIGGFWEVVEVDGRLMGRNLWEEAPLFDITAEQARLQNLHNDYIRRKTEQDVEKDLAQFALRAAARKAEAQPSQHKE